MHLCIHEIKCYTQAQQGQFSILDYMWKKKLYSWKINALNTINKYKNLKYKKAMLHCAQR